MRGRVRCLVVLGVGVCVLVLGGCGGRVGGAAGTFHPAVPGALTVVTESVPSIGMWEGSVSHPTGGFEYAIARELASRFGLRRVIIRTASFGSIVSGDLHGADLALAMITPTSARERHLSFSSPYDEATPAILVRTGTHVPDVHAARTLRFAASDATTFRPIIDDLIRPVTPTLTIESQDKRIAAVESHQADAMFLDLPVAQAVVEWSSGGLSIACQLDQTEPIAAALPKGSDNVEAVSSALRAMDNDGTLDRLAKRWLGRSLTSESDNVPLLRTDAN